MMKEIVEINGKKFLSEEKVKQDYVTMKEYKMLQKEAGKLKKEHINLFSTKEESKIHNALGKLFCDVSCPVSETWALKQERVVVFDPATVCLIASRSDRAKLILRRYIDAEDEEKKFPELKYKLEKEPLKSKYANNYMKKAMDIFIASSIEDDDNESVTIKVSKDYPMTIYNKDFEFVLAPRVED